MALITRVDGNNSAFQRSFNALQPDIQKEARIAIALLFMADLRTPPARLHLHSLKSRLVPSILAANKKVKVYTFHLTSMTRGKPALRWKKELPTSACADRTTGLTFPRTPSRPL